MKFDAPRRHFILAGLWAFLAIPTVLFWKDSVLWVAFLSLYANFASEVGAAHASRADKNSQSPTEE